MAFGDTINTEKASGSSGEASVTISPTPTSGNLLVFAVGRASPHGAGGSWGTPSGWTLLHDSGINVGSMGGAVFWKISDGTETSVATAGTNPAGGWQATVAEYEGPFAASPLDVAAENIDNISTVVTSQTTGTTGTTAQNDELAIACWAFDATQNVDGSRTYSSSFTEVVFNDQSAARAGSMQAKKILSATGTVECTFSCTDTGDEMYGAIGVFKKASSGTQYTQDVSGAITPPGTVTKQTSKIVTGGITPTGSLINQTSKILSGSNTPIGTLTKQTNKILSGALSSIVGTLTAIKTALVDLSGSITPLGTTLKQSGKSLLGSNTPTGTISKLISKFFSGSSTSTGTIIKQTNKSLSGNISSITGSLIKLINILRGGSITPTGTLSRGISKIVSGVISSIVGTLTRIFSGGDDSVPIAGHGESVTSNQRETISSVKRNRIKSRRRDIG